MPLVRRPAGHNFHQLFGKLTGQQALKGICQFAVIPERVFFRSFPESTPYSRADFWFPQVTKNRARVVNFIRQRNQAGLSVNRFQMLDVSHLARLPGIGESLDGPEIRQIKGLDVDGLVARRPA